MKKNLFTLIAMMMAVVLSAGFASCSSDDDDESDGNSDGNGVTVKESDLFGTWRRFYKHVTEEEYDADTKKWVVTKEKSYSEDKCNDKGYRFNEDMTLDKLAYIDQNEYNEGHYEWKIDGSKLMVKKTSKYGDNAEWEHYRTITGFKDGILELEDYYEDEDDRETETERFKKIN